MIDNERFEKLLLKWAADIDEYRFEVQRLELNNRTRHATSIATLEARAQAVDQCALELKRLVDLVAVDGSASSPS